MAALAACIAVSFKAGNPGMEGDGCEGVACGGCSGEGGSAAPLLPALIQGLAFGAGGVAAAAAAGAIPPLGSRAGSC